jgi:hypothetical protein
MTAPRCIKPGLITITANIAAFIECLCVATVPAERRMRTKRQFQISGEN